jgi:hypothetical protein
MSTEENKEVVRRFIAEVFVKGQVDPVRPSARAGEPEEQRRAIAPGPRGSWVDTPHGGQGNPGQGLDMKTLLLVVVVALVCVVLFVVGVFLPARSRRMQEGVDRLSRTGERKSEEKAGPFRGLTRSGFRLLRGAADKSAEQGREIHHKATS